MCRCSHSRTGPYGRHERERPRGDWL
jgi:hypothetical protein